LVYIIRWKNELEPYGLQITINIAHSRWSWCAR